MAHQWEPQQILEPPLALDLIREQFPDLPLFKIRLLGAGWDNTAFVINEDLIFRFPRREIAIPLLETEWCILPKLAPRLSLPIPIPKWRGSPTDLPEKSGQKFASLQKLEREFLEVRK